jgi:recombination DNA repair RAD52 pathway protein
MLSNFGSLMDGAQDIKRKSLGDSGGEYTLVFSDKQIAHIQAEVRAADDAVERAAAPLRAYEAVCRDADADVWSSVWDELPPAVRTALAATTQAYSAAQLQAAEAFDRLQVHRERRPSKADDVPRWAARDAELKQTHSAYEGFADQARTAYEAAAARALTALRSLVTQRHAAAGAGVDMAESDAKALEAQARAIRETAHGRQSALGRLHNRVYQQGIAFFEEVEL